MLVKEVCLKYCKDFFLVKDLVVCIENVVKEIKWFKKDNCDIYIFCYMFFYEIIVYYFGKNNRIILLICMGSNFIVEKVLLKEEFLIGLIIFVEFEKF